MDITDFDIIDDQDLLADIQPEAEKTIEPFTVDVTLGDEEIVEEKVKAVEIETAEDNNEEETKQEEAATSTDSVFQEYADNLVEMGIFFPEEGEEKVTIGSPEEFAQRFEKSYQTGAINHVESIVGQYGPEHAEAFDAIYVKGMNPREYFTKSADIQDYEQLDLETEDAQKKVYRDYMSRQGLAPERIEAKLQKMLDMGDLEEEAKDYHQLLVSAQKQDLQARIQQTEQQRVQYEQQVAAYNNLTISTIESKLKEKDFDGIPLTPAKAQSVKDYLLRPAYKLPTGQTISEYEHFIYELNKPENVELKIKVALLAQEKFKTDSIVKKNISEKTTKLFQNLSNKEKQQQRSQPKQRDFFIS